MTITYYKTKHGSILLGDSLDYLAKQKPATIDLIVTSPPFGLVRKKDYGNVESHEYTEWFRPFGAEFKRVLKPSGSLVIDIGGAWIPGQPTRSLYHFELAIMLCREFALYLAQEFFWWNPSKLPTPAEWVTVRRVRVKDAVNVVWWLSHAPLLQASNDGPVALTSLALRRNRERRLRTGLCSPRNLSRPSARPILDSYRQAKYRRK